MRCQESKCRDKRQQGMKLSSPHSCQWQLTFPAWSSLRTTFTSTPLPWQTPASSWNLPFTLTALPHQVPMYLKLMLVTP